MSSKHKDRGRPQPKKGYDSRHQHRENRHSTLYTPKQLRDSTTKATEDMNKIYQSFWAKKPLYGHVTNVNNELEVNFEFQDQVLCSIALQGSFPLVL